jgi:hypothetical protein
MSKTPISRNDSPANSEMVRKHLPFGIFGDWEAPLKIPNVTSCRQAILLHQSYLDKQQELFPPVHLVHLF